LLELRQSLLSPAFALRPLGFLPGRQLGHPELGNRFEIPQGNGRHPS
jgi:hypothetical protein